MNSPCYPNSKSGPNSVFQFTKKKLKSLQKQNMRAIASADETENKINDTRNVTEICYNLSLHNFFNVISN